MQFKSIRSVGTEVASIVIGVLLALGVNEWNEDRTHFLRYLLLIVFFGPISLVSFIFSNFGKGFDLHNL